MARQIGKNQIDGGGHHGRSGGKAIQAIGEIDRIRGADNDQHRKNHIEPAEIRTNVLQERESSNAVEARVQKDDKADHGGPDDLQNQFAFGAQALGIVLLYLSIIIDEADDPIKQGDKRAQARPSMLSSRAHSRVPTVNGRENQQPAHGRHPLFGQMGCRTIITDHLADLETPHGPDKQRPENQDIRKAVTARADRAEGNITENIENVQIRMEGIEKMIQHTISTHKVDYLMS